MEEDEELRERRERKADYLLQAFTHLRSFSTVTDPTERQQKYNSFTSSENLPHAGAPAENLNEEEEQTKQAPSAPSASTSACLLTPPARHDIQTEGY